MMLATTPRAATPATTAATAARIALLFVGVLAAAPASGLGPDAAILTTGDAVDDNEGMRGVRRETSPASLRAPRQQRKPTPDAHAGNKTR
jgi:hypothetical protein